MKLLMLFVGFTAFVIGLYQWAFSGASLWRMREIRRMQRNGTLPDTEISSASDEMRRLEKAADRALTFSAKVIGGLAIFTWLFLGATVLMDMFDIDWTSALSGRARRYWNTTSSSASGGGTLTQNRNDILRGLGSSMR